MSDQIIAGTSPNHFSIGPLNQRIETNPESDRFFLQDGYVTFTPLLVDTTATTLLHNIPEISL